MVLMHFIPTVDRNTFWTQAGPPPPSRGSHLPVGGPIFIIIPIFRPRTLKFGLQTHERIINPYLILNWEPKTFGTPRGPIPLKKSLFLPDFMFSAKSSHFIWFSCTFRSPQLTVTHFGPSRIA